MCSSTAIASPAARALSSCRYTQQNAVALGGSQAVAFVRRCGAAAAGKVSKTPAPAHFFSTYPNRLRVFSAVTAPSTPSAKTISVGEKLPDADLSYFDKEGNLQTVSVSELTKGKKVVLFAVPGAFTPTCSQKHLPGFVDKAEELRSKGVDTIACISVNDTFVMKAWGESIGVGDNVLLLSDGNATFTKALGVTVDLSDKPALLGVRSRRYALLAEDGVVKVLNLEEGGAFTVSGPDEILKAL